MYDYAPPPSHYEYAVKSIKLDKTHKRYKDLAFNSMRYLEGWCSERKAGRLMDIVWEMDPQIVVEIGVFGGKSLVPMAYALKAKGSGVVYGIDPWSCQASAEGMDGANKTWWESIDHEAILSGLQTKVKQFQLSNYIKLVQATSVDADPIYGIDILHIDGNHSEAASYADTLKWVPLVREGGIIIFDDITWGTTSKATDWLDQHCQRVESVQDVENEWAIWIKK